MSSGGAETIPVAHGASLHIAMPDGAIAEAPSALPAIDVSTLPGATVPVRVGFSAGEMSVRAVCATAPSRGWAPGVEQIVMGRASQIARGAIGGEIARFDATDTLAVGARFEQRFEAEVKRDGASASASASASARVIGKHVLGFAGESRDAIVCSVVCVEPVGARACGGMIDGARAEGAWVEAPAASVVVRGILLAAERPVEATAGVGVVAMMMAAVVIARRPRPRAC